MGREVMDSIVDKDNDTAYSNGDVHESLDLIPVEGEVRQQNGQVKETSDVENKEFTEMGDEENTLAFPTGNTCNDLDTSFAKMSCQDNDQCVKGVDKDDMLDNQKKSSSSIKPIMRAGNVTVDEPFTLASEKRELKKIGADATSGGNKKLGVNVLSPRSKQPQLIKPLKIDNDKHGDEEDNCSVASSTAASVRASKSGTTGSAPSFRVTQRAEKRKEFYQKLEEKHQALEAEKNQSEAKTKEEREAALKQLRKNMTFKANPMPSFYHDGPPPKVELKKIPTTRAKSPKFNRRKSFNDAANSADTKTTSGKLNRHSLGSYKEDNQKAKINGRNGISPRMGTKQVRSASKEESHKATEQPNVDIAAES